MNESRNTQRSAESPARPSERTPGGDGAASIEPGAGRASGLRDAGALTGFRSPPKNVIVRAPRPEDLPICQLGGCHDPIVLVVVAPGVAGERKAGLCQRHAQDLLMELAELIGVGRRQAVPS